MIIGRRQSEKATYYMISIIGPSGKYNTPETGKGTNGFYPVQE